MAKNLSQKKSQQDQNTLSFVQVLEQSTIFTMFLSKTATPKRNGTTKNDC